MMKGAGGMGGGGEDVKVKSCALSFHSVFDYTIQACGNIAISKLWTCRFF